MGFQARHLNGDIYVTSKVYLGRRLSVQVFFSKERQWFEYSESIFIK